MWGWRSDKTENINGYECKVFSATNVELVTKTRTEHLTETDKANAKNKNNKTPLHNFLGIAEVEENQAIALPPNVSKIFWNLLILNVKYFKKIFLCKISVKKNLFTTFPGRIKQHYKSLQHFPGRIFRCRSRSARQRHRKAQRGQHENTKVQGHVVAFGTVSFVSARADSSDSRLNGHFQFAFCQT